MAIEGMLALLLSTRAGLSIEANTRYLQLSIHLDPFVDVRPMLA
jgi:hypothetical protein